MEQRIVIYAPTGKDAILGQAVLADSALECLVCRTIGETVDILIAGAGALIIAEEVLTPEAITPLARFVEQQPDWSDLPIIVLTNYGVRPPRLQAVIEQLGNFTLLDRPMRSTSLIIAARSALRGRRRQYQMRETDRLKDAFLASLGHELRNPLAPIRIATQVLDRTFPDAPAAKKLVGIIERQVAHLTRLVDDLLDVARVSNGKITLQRAPVRLSTIVDHAVEICRPLFDAGRHQIEITVPAEDPLVDGDRARLVQSLANVLANAAKFSPSPSVIYFSAVVEKNAVIFRIKDNGIGLAPASLQRIFEMFTQGDPARGQALGGLGIGLSLTKQFVEMHGGRIDARSDGIGFGAEFIVTLPIVLSGGFASPVDTVKVTPPQASEKALSILVVDDNRDGADLLHAMLEMDGYQVAKAYDARQALELVRLQRPDIVLMDVGLPDMDGYEATRRIRQQPDGKHILVVALTGWGHEDARRKAIDAGMDHHMVKPVDLVVLSGFLEQVAAR